MNTSWIAGTLSVLYVSGRNVRSTYPAAFAHGTRTSVIVTLPDSVSRWPRLSQSSWKTIPSCADGTIAKTWSSVPSRMPSSTVRSDTLLPVENDLRPL